MTLLHGLLLLAACVLAGIPYLLAVLNFRRRTAVKRRALLSILSDEDILRQYQHRFPNRKGLDNAESIAQDYFSTYYNRSEYMAGLALNFFTGSAALILILTQIGFHPSFVSRPSRQIRPGRAIRPHSPMGVDRQLSVELLRPDPPHHKFQSAARRLHQDVAETVVCGRGRRYSLGRIAPGLQPVLGFAIGLISIP